MGTSPHNSLSPFSMAWFNKRPAQNPPRAPGSLLVDALREADWYNDVVLRRVYTGAESASRDRAGSITVGVDYGAGDDFTSIEPHVLAGLADQGLEIDHAKSTGGITVFRKKLPPPHPDTGKVVARPPRLRRSMVGVVVEDVRLADGSISRRPGAGDRKKVLKAITKGAT